MSRSCARSLAILAAFVAAQVESLDHRARHAAEEAAEAGDFLCPYGEEAVHLCSDRVEADHAPDCALCAAGTILIGAPAAGPGRDVPTLQARVFSFEHVPSAAPDAGRSAPRGPPV